MKGGKRMAARRGLAAALLAAALAALAPEARAADAAALCDVPDVLDYSDVAFPAVAAKLKAGEEARIVVIGSASSAGTDLTTSVRPYPDRLVAALQRQFANGHFAVVNLSARGVLASAMEARFAHDVLPLGPALVVWQTGTVEVVRGIDLEEFADTLADGLMMLRKRGVDVVLMNMQYSAQTSIVVDPGRYLDAMRSAAQSQGAMLFDRYGIMRYWEGSGLIDFTSPAKADQARDDNLVHDCIAELLAEKIAKAVGRAQDSVGNP
jgi:hypothetical protein